MAVVKTDKRRKGLRSAVTAECCYVRDPLPTQNTKAPGLNQQSETECLPAGAGPHTSGQMKITGAVPVGGEPGEAPQGVVQWLPVAAVRAYGSAFCPVFVFKSDQESGTLCKLLTLNVWQYSPCGQPVCDFCPRQADFTFPSQVWAPGELQLPLTQPLTPKQTRQCSVRMVLRELASHQVTCFPISILLPL